MNFKKYFLSLIFKKILLGDSFMISRKVTNLYKQVIQKIRGFMLNPIIFSSIKIKSYFFQIILVWYNKYIYYMKLNLI